MNIFLISNMFPTQTNPGYGVFVKNICDGLEENDVHTIYYAVIKGKSSRRAKLATYIRFYWRIISNYFKQYDVCYVHYPTHAALLLSLLNKIKKKPIVFNFHGEDLLYDNHSCYMSFLGHMSDRMTGQTTFVVVPSEYYRDIVLARGLISNDRIVISPSGGINDDLFFYKGGKNKKNYYHLGFVGRLERDKGVLDFIEACVALNKQFGIKATIIGYGPLNEIVLESTKNYSFFTVILGVTQDKLPDYYRSFDLFYFPSSREAESLGLVGIEAMACGTPVIGSNIGGIKSFVNHGVNGYLLSLDDLTGDMIKYTNEFIKLADCKKENMINNAVMTARKYSRKTVCEQLSKEFKSRI